MGIVHGERGGQQQPGHHQRGAGQRQMQCFQRVADLPGGTELKQNRQNAHHAANADQRQHFTGAFILRARELADMLRRADQHQPPQKQQVAPGQQVPAEHQALQLTESVRQQQVAQDARSHGKQQPGADPPIVLNRRWHLHDERSSLSLKRR
ncbi:hypothetical protein D3C78_1419980 [compost metagenome]